MRERTERSPFANFIYGAITGLACDAEAAVATLQNDKLSMRERFRKLLRLMA